MKENDLNEYTVVRIADEFVVDLLLKAGGKKYEEVIDGIEYIKIEDVVIPFANPLLLYQLKQTWREKDNLDILFLKDLLKNQEN